jgi:hypothetical protein
MFTKTVGRRQKHIRARLTNIDRVHPSQSYCIPTTFKMKVPFITLPLWAVLFYIVKACDINMPNILLAVQFAGRGAIGTQQSTEFLVPLYSDCDYVSLASSVQASNNPHHKNRDYFTNKFITGGSVPTTAVFAYFPGDAFGFSGSDGLLLNSHALDNFLQSLSSTVSASIDVDATLSLVICTVTTSNRT